MAKIIMMDNYNREMVADILVCENVNDRFGKRIVECLNENRKNDDEFFQTVEDDYRLSRGLEDLI
jgi:hypothetical protein